MQHYIQRMKQEDGFTLIELLIVIIVIGILAGIAIFGTQFFQEDAETACNEANDRITASADAAADATGRTTADYIGTPGDC
jgi:prepilin-type N-terminal cleavage/methylation domain-containing protein